MRAIIVVFVLVLLSGCSDEEQDKFSSELLSGLADEKLQKSRSKIARGAGRVGVVSAALNIDNVLRDRENRVITNFGMKIVKKQAELVESLKPMCILFKNHNNKSINQVALYSLGLKNDERGRFQMIQQNLFSADWILTELDQINNYHYSTTRDMDSLLNSLGSKVRVMRARVASLSNTDKMLASTVLTDNYLKVIKRVMKSCENL